MALLHINASQVVPAIEHSSLVKTSLWNEIPTVRMAWKCVSTDWSSIDTLAVIKLDSPETVHFDAKHWIKHVWLLVLIAKSQLNQFASVLQVNISGKMRTLPSN